MPVGKVVRWHADKGFGFIKPEDDGDDIFCHASDLQDGDGSVAEGDEVRYEVKWDDRKGKDRAAEVEVTKEGPGPRGGGGGGKGGGRDRSRSRGGGGGRSGGGGRGGGGGSGTGTMLRWNNEKGFGFIKPDDDGEDIFCHASKLADGDGSVQDGDKVTFDKQVNDRNGKDCAVNVKLASGGGRSRGGGGDRDRRGGGGRDRSRSRSRDRRRRRDRSPSQSESESRHRRRRR